MPLTQAATGMGAIFSIGDSVDGASTTYTPVSQEVTSITPPGMSREAIDATHLLSPDEFREFIPGLLDTEPAVIAFNYIPGAADACYTALLAGKGDFRITYPNGVELDFSGIPTGWKPGDATQALMAGEFTVKPTSKPVITAAP